MSDYDIDHGTEDAGPTVAEQVSAALNPLLEQFQHFNRSLEEARQASAAPQGDDYGYDDYADQRPQVDQSVVSDRKSMAHVMIGQMQGLPDDVRAMASQVVDNATPAEVMAMTARDIALVAARNAAGELALRPSAQPQAQGAQSKAGDMVDMAQFAWFKANGMPNVTLDEYKAAGFDKDPGCRRTYLENTGQR